MLDNCSAGWSNPTNKKLQPFCGQSGTQGTEIGNQFEEVGASVLEHLSPREFEEFCKSLLTCHLKCVVELTPPTGDGGRDLLVRHPHGLIVVECKHHPNGGVVGRPVVQKLHSAVLTENATHGMIITTGRFSAEAEDRAQNLGMIQVDLIDAAKLAHLISITFPGGLAPPSLSSAIWTTPDADFPQAFAGTIFAAPRYEKGSTSFAQVRVSVRRETRYLGYYTATFEAEGEIDSAVGTFTENWAGTVWLRADRQETGFGSPRLNGAEMEPLAPLSQVLQSVQGRAEPPTLHPQKAISAMTDFIVGSCRKVVYYSGRNNVGYRRVVTPSRSKVYIHPPMLCYVPLQSFALQIGNTCHEGIVEEEQSPCTFHVDCPSLSKCTVCGTATTATNQILCCVCFRPAHRWTWLFPDSHKCKECGGLVCRKHATRRGRKVVCVRCHAGGKKLQPRWLAHCLFGVGASAISVSGALLSPIGFLPVAVAVGIASWTPLLCLLMQPAVLKETNDLVYREADHREEKR